MAARLPRASLVITSTGRPDPEAGGDAHLRKPFDQGALDSAVRRALPPHPA